MPAKATQDDVETAAQLEPLDPGTTHALVRDLRSGFGLRREKFSRLTGFSVRALAGWESGSKTPGQQARLRLIELERLVHALSQVVRTAAISTWLDTPNPAFDDLKPLEVVERGQIDRLWRMIFHLESGVAS